LKDIDESEKALRVLKERLDETVRGLGNKVSERGKLLELAAYLYWMIPEVRPEPLAEAVIGERNTHRLRKQLPAITAGIHCDRCNAPLSFKSRSQLQDAIREAKGTAKLVEQGISLWAEGYIYVMVCKSCRKEILSERAVREAKETQARQRRLDELRRMPYPEYLRTPEWQARRLRHLQSAGNRCQVCNAPGPQLDVHHRTYKRRGEELFQDLIVLCRNCHTLFHREGRLAS